MRIAIREKIIKNLTVYRIENVSHNNELVMV